MRIRPFTHLLRTFSLVFATACTNASAQTEIITGPYLQAVSPDSVTVMWETGQPTDGWVEYWEEGTLVAQKGSNTSTAIHGVRVTGLEADTAYHYRVRSGSTRSESAVFFTSPPRGESGFRFVAYGDSRRDDWVHTEVALAIDEAIDRGFILHTGDIVPTPMSGPALYREDFFTPLASVIDETPIFLARGNHEGLNPWTGEYFAHPSEGSGNEFYYSFDYGNLHVVVVDMMQFHHAGSDQVVWLESDLQAASTDAAVDWIVVGFHYPPYSTGHHGSYLEVRSVFCPLFEAYGVDLVLNGHDHNYERISEQNGVVYIVTGGGGAPLRDQETTEPWSACFEKNFHFVTVDVTEETLSVVARGVQVPGQADGDPIDSVVIARGNRWSPTAHAGPDRLVNFRLRTELDGSASFDGEARPFGYEWVQVAGPSVTLSRAHTVRPSFVPTKTGVYGFLLTCAGRNDLDSVPDRVDIAVLDPILGGEWTSSSIVDTWIDSSNPDVNYGTASTMTVDAQAPRGTAYLRFPLPDQDIEILSAKLELYGLSGSDCGGYVRFFSDRSWNETGPTFNTPLEIDGPVAGVFGEVVVNKWATADITPFLAEWLAGRGPSLSLAVVPGSTNRADYETKEGAHSPRLVLTLAQHPRSLTGH